MAYESVQPKRSMKETMITTVDWKILDAFPILKSETESENTMFSKMDSIRLSQTCGIAERVWYVKVWCCLASWMKKQNTVHSSVQIWFRMDNYETGCYWFELIFHLSIVGGELMRLLPSVTDNDITDINSTVVACVKGFIGCCVFVETTGLPFNTVPASYGIVKDTYQALIEMKVKIRQRCLYGLALKYAHEQNHRDAYLFCTAFLEDASEHKHALQIQARTASTLALEQGLFSDAVRILKACKDLQKEYMLLAASLPLSATTENAMSHSFQPPRSFQKLLSQGENPLLSPMCTRIFQ